MAVMCVLLAAYNKVLSHIFMLLTCYVNGHVCLNSSLMSLNLSRAPMAQASSGPSSCTSPREPTIYFYQLVHQKLAKICTILHLKEIFMVGDLQPQVKAFV